MGVGGPFNIWSGGGGWRVGVESTSILQVGKSRSYRLGVDGRLINNNPR
jgi:hypothetical protein